jgi:hypothetical protein
VSEQAKNIGWVYILHSVKIKLNKKVSDLAKNIGWVEILHSVKKKLNK